MVVSLNKGLNINPKDFFKERQYKSFDIWQMDMDRADLVNTYSESLLKDLSLLLSIINECYFTGINFFDFLNKNHSKNDDLIIYYKSNAGDILDDYLNKFENISFIELKEEEHITDKLLEAPFTFQQCAYDVFNKKIYVSDECRESIALNHIVLKNNIEFKDIDDLENKDIYLNSFNLALKEYYFLNEKREM